MPVRTRPAAWQRAQQEHRHLDVSLVGADEVVRAPLEGQVLLPDMMHGDLTPQFACVVPAISANALRSCRSASIIEQLE
jgi:hypothetical protein